MTDAPTCERCGDRIHDTAYVCSRCASWLASDLDLVAKVAGEAMVTIGRLDRIARVGGRGEDVAEDTSCTCPTCTDPDAAEPDSALYPTSWPVNLGAGVRHDAAVGELTTWVRHVAETRGIPGPPYATHSAEQGQRVHPLTACAAWLTGQLDWLRHRPEAAEAFDALVAACRVILRVVDRGPERVIVGQCPCQVVREDGRPAECLYAVRGAAQVTCRSCGTSYDVDSTRDMLKRRLDQALFTGAEIATLVAYLGEGQREPIRKLIKVWHSRGLLVVHDYGGQPAYRFGEVISRLAQRAS
jgi:hypothetical protein